MSTSNHKQHRVVEPSFGDRQDPQVANENEGEGGPEPKPVGPVEDAYFSK
jgi:hypothetical protein